ncbi:MULTISPECIES: hypothetical protein [Neisseria]|uniref:hypothetical protein n=1 Tax=Neisseria TaxID=482 RepID=UPI001EFE0144|nr:hypothetical protein [Neisseria polysaccharea]
MPSETLPIIGMWFQTAFVLFSVYSAKVSVRLSVLLSEQKAEQLIACANGKKVFKAGCTAFFRQSKAT